MIYLTLCKLGILITCTRMLKINSFPTIILSIGSTVLRILDTINGSRLCISQYEKVYVSSMRVIRWAKKWKIENRWPGLKAQMRISTHIHTHKQIYTHLPKRCVCCTIYQKDMGSPIEHNPGLIEHTGKTFLFRKLGFSAQMFLNILPTCRVAKKISMIYSISSCA